MPKVNKKRNFNCVEMKNRIQGRVQAEFEERKVEFKSFAEYVNSQCEESDWTKGIIEKIKKAHKIAKKSA